MNDKLYTYAFVKSLYDQRKDYFDTFLVLVLNIVEDTRFLPLLSIQERIKNKYELDIPIHVLKTICNRGKIKGYLLMKDGAREYQLSKKGNEYLGTQEQSIEIERRINSLLSDLVDFYKTKGKTISIEDTKKLLLNFINDNIEGLIDFLNPRNTSTEAFIPCIERQDAILLIDYLKEAQIRKPTEYKQLEEMIYGSIISTVLATENSADVSDFNTRKFRKSQIFLDTNFIFSLLGFHSREKNKAAEELHFLLKQAGFKLKAFDFTVDEVCRVVNGYLQNKNKFPSNIPIDSVFSFLKKKGWEYSDVAEFINTIDITLRDKGIDILDTDIADLSQYSSPINDSLRNEISKSKPSDGRGLSTNHDLAAIDKIRELRKHSVRRIEEAEAFFLTSDNSLQRIALYALGHNEKGTLCEVILDRVLANIVWLKNPNAKLSLNTIISAHSRDLLIDRKIWERFYRTLEKLKKDGAVSDHQIEILFYHNNISNLLRELDKSDADNITDKLAMEVIEDAVKTISNEKKELLKANKVKTRSYFKLKLRKKERFKK
jgi:hypothetical protein